MIFNPSEYILNGNSVCFITFYIMFTFCNNIYSYGRKIISVFSTLLFLHYIIILYFIKITVLRRKSDVPVNIFFFKYRGHENKSTSTMYGFRSYNNKLIK